MKKNSTQAYQFSTSSALLFKTGKRNYLITALLVMAGLFSSIVSKGQAGEALDFDGSKQNKVALPFQLSGSYTKEAWINASDLSNFPNILSGTNTTALYLNGGVLSCGHSFPYTEVQDVSPIVTGTWYHVAVTYDAASGLVTLYRDGSAVGSATVEETGGLGRAGTETQ